MFLVAQNFGIATQRVLKNINYFIISIVTNRVVQAFSHSILPFRSFVGSLKARVGGNVCKYIHTINIYRQTKERKYDKVSLNM